MREILFRGKHQETGKWVYGSFIPDLMEVYQNGPDGWLGDWGFIKPFEKDKNGMRHMTYVQRDTVGQYTGLTDKNGVKIFEGDIVFYENTGSIFEVRYNFSEFLLVDKARLFHEIPLIIDDYFEVIGNIYDNPELMEDKQC